MLCVYGCGLEAEFVLKNGNQSCSKSPNSCPANKAKNSKSLKEVHASGEKGYTYNDKSAWSRGRTAVNDPRISSKYQVETLFTYNGRGPHKKILISELGHKCQSCDNSEWLGKPITLELEHVDGDSLNNTRENLKLLCPNCHSQTETWRRRKAPGKESARTDEEMQEAIVTSMNLHQCLHKLGLKWGSYKTIENFRTKNNLRFGSNL